MAARRAIHKMKQKAKKLEDVAKAVKPSMKALSRLSGLEYVVTLPDYNEPGPQLEVSGTVYKRTPVHQTA